MSGARDTWVNPGLALLLCALAGAAFARLGLPLPWMSGPLLAMAACNFAGAALRSPPGARSVGQIVIGAALGLYFTPAVAAQVAAHWWLLLLAALTAILVGVLGAWVLSGVAGVDGGTAFFASVPGGAAEMAVLGERYHARVDRIALAQSLRILVVVLTVPLALTYSGARGADLYMAVAPPLHWGGVAALLAFAAACAGACTALRLPNAFFFGPLAVGVALTVNDVQLSSLPQVLTNPAQMLLGCSLGARFERGSLESAPRYVAAVLASVALAMLVSAAFAWLIAVLAGLPIPTLILAMAPGGIAEMCITAKVLQLGVPLVTAAHVVRVLVLILASGWLFRLLRTTPKQL